MCNNFDSKNLYVCDCSKSRPRLDVTDDLPEFLNTSEKYYNVITETKTLEDFENLIYRLMEFAEARNSVSNFYNLMKNVQQDIHLYHGNHDIDLFVELIENMLLYFIIRRMDEEIEDNKRNKEEI